MLCATEYYKLQYINWTGTKYDTSAEAKKKKNITQRRPHSKWIHFILEIFETYVFANNVFFYMPCKY